MIKTSFRRSTFCIALLPLAPTLVCAETPRGPSSIGPAYQQAAEMDRTFESEFASHQELNTNLQKQADAEKTGTKEVTLHAEVMEKRSHNRTRVKRGLEKNFLVLEDGVPQDIKVRFIKSADTPITTVFLFEWRDLMPINMLPSPYSYIGRDYINMLQYIVGQAANFVNMIDEEKDWAAIIAYNDYMAAFCTDKDPVKKKRCEDDDEERFRRQWIIQGGFTRNKQEAVNGLARLAQSVIPFTTNSGFFDTLNGVIDRLKDKPGLKTIVVVGSGIDTGLAQYRDKIVKTSSKSGIQIFTVGTGIPLQAWMEEYLRAPLPSDFGITGQVFKIPGSSDFQIGKGNLKELSIKTGGQFYEVRGLDELQEKYRDIFKASRSQYEITYSPKNGGASPKKLEVLLVELDADGHPVPGKKGRPKPLEVVNKKGKKVEIELDAPKNRPPLSD